MDKSLLERLQGRLGLGVCLVGFVVLFLGWNGAASYADVRQQFPYLISGGVAGLSLVVLGSALLVVEALRAQRAELVALVEELRAAQHGRSSRAAVDGPDGGDLPVVDGLVLAADSSFHRPGCKVVQGRPGLDLVEPVEALAAGLTPCRVCRAGDLVGT